MAGHAQLKFVMTECSKTQIRLTGLILENSKTVKFDKTIADLLSLILLLKNKYYVNGPRQANLCLRAFRHDKF